MGGLVSMLAKAGGNNRGDIVASKRFDDDNDPNTPCEWENKYFFYNYDMRGSTTAIIKPDGNSVTQYTYDEFGNLSQTGEAAFKNEVTFTSSISDMSTGLQYMNSRYYDSTTGRFISQDTYTGNPYDPWTQNLYSYCGGNPTNFIDPTGHEADALSLYKQADNYYKLADSYNEKAANLYTAYTKLKSNVLLNILLGPAFNNLLNDTRKLADANKGIADSYLYYANETMKKADAVKANAEKIKKTEGAVEKVLKNNAAMTSSETLDPFAFYNHNQDDGLWNYKVQKTREDNADLKSIASEEYVYYKGNYMSWEEFGNFNYAYAGKAALFPLPILNWGSEYAAKINYSQEDKVDLYYKIANEKYDQQWIERGINQYLVDSLE